MLAEQKHKPRFQHIDCLRGYAVLMVIATHTAVRFADLPWRFKELVSSGWHGVQLFFIASMLTLLMSAKWESSTKGSVNWLGFYIRRLFRIAPAFYFAALIYSLLGWNHDVTPAAIVGFFSFATAWIPRDLGYGLVPGAWSVSVEFSMYLLFPLIAIYCRGIFRGTLLLIGTILLAYAADHAAASCLAGRLSQQDLDNYIYFSFFNQLPVFALANLFYDFAYEKLVSNDRLQISCMQSRVIIVLALAMLVIAAYLPLPRSFDAERPLPPNFFFCAFWMCVFIYGIVGARHSDFTNKYVASIGQVSFSAYLWHWVVIDGLCRFHFASVLTAQARYSALATYVILFLLVVAITYAIARVSYQFIEQPGIALSRGTIARLQARAKHITEAKTQLSYEQREATGVMPE